MSVIRVEKTKNYTVMSNHHLRNKELSLKAKGLMSLMLSLPDEWDYSVKGLATLSKDKLDGVRSGLKELENQGYLIRYQKREKDGRMAAAEYILRELPQQEKPVTENPTTVKPISENPMTENPTQINTDIIKYLPKEVQTKENKEGIYSLVVDFLNSEIGTSYKSTTGKTRKCIDARLKEGFTLDDFKTVIRKKCRQWYGDAKMNAYLRPETLFGNKFEGYLNEPEVTVMSKQAVSGDDRLNQTLAMFDQLGID